MKVEVYVQRHDNQPNRDGTAYVFIDGRLHAKVRSGECYVVETSESVATTHQPGLTRAALNARAAA